MAKRQKPSKKIANPKSEAERHEALKAALGKIEKEIGKGAIMLLGEDDYNLDIETISTGALSLDLALGVGGLPKGRVIEIYGAESSGKTTVALHVVAEAQKAGGIAAFIDAEHALDPGYAKNIGVDIDHLIISQPDNGEEALEVAEALARSGAIDVIVVDSVAALVPRSEIEGEMGEQAMGVQARLMSKALRKLSGVLHKSDTMIIFINQLREKIGIVFGNPEVTTGGRSLKFYSSVRLEVRKADNIREGDEIVGSKTKVKVVKNKVAPPFREAEFDIIYGEGISQAGCILDLAADVDIINKSGSWYSYGDTRIAQGRDNARAWLEEHEDIMAEIDQKVRDHYSLADDEEAEDMDQPTDGDLKSGAGTVEDGPVDLDELDELLDLDLDE